MASTAARTTGKCWGRQPAITALIAAFSAVITPWNSLIGLRGANGSPVAASTIWNGVSMMPVPVLQPCMKAVM